jgi:hypothetical protein
MRLKDLVLTFFALSLLVISFEAHAQMPEDCQQKSEVFKKTANPHHKLLIAKENCVRKKEDGERVISQAEDQGLKQLLFHCFVVNDENRNTCSQDFVYDRESGIIFFHARLNSAPFSTVVQQVYEAILGY